MPKRGTTKRRQKKSGRTRKKQQITEARKSFIEEVKLQRIKTMREIRMHPEHIRAAEKLSLKRLMQGKDWKNQMIFIRELDKARQGK